MEDRKWNKNTNMEDRKIVKKQKKNVADRKMEEKECERKKKWWKCKVKKKKKTVKDRKMRKKKEKNMEDRKMVGEEEIIFPLDTTFW